MSIRNYYSTKQNKTFRRSNISSISSSKLSISIDDNRKSNKNQFQRNFSCKTSKKNIREVIPDEKIDHLSTFFDQKKRKVYFNSIIDNYFQQQSSQNPQASSSFIFSRKHSSRSKRSQIPTQKNVEAFISNETFFNGSLPIINQINNVQRPMSEHQSRRVNVNELSIESQSMYFTKETEKEDLPLFERQQEYCNQHYRVINLKQDGKNVSKVKIYTSELDEMFQRQIKMKQIGIPLLWKTTQRNTAIEYSSIKSFREDLYTIVEQTKGEETIFEIYPKKAYHQLLFNQGQQIIDIVVSICGLLNKANGRVANHQINIDNIFKKEQKEYYLGDWGCSSFYEEIIIRNKKIVYQKNPLCKEDDKWLVIPQYLSPELLNAIQNQNQSFTNIWRNSNKAVSCDMWSIGCLIFELLTLVPLWIPYACKIKGQFKFQKGFLAVPKRNPNNIMIKQKYFKGSALRSIKEKYKHCNTKISTKLLKVMSSLLQINPENRMSPAEVVKFLI